MAEKRGEGFEPWAMDAWSMDPWTRTMSSALRFWLSFWPVAPLFGVEWRFAGLASGTDPQTGERSETAVERAISLGTVPAARAAEAAAEAAAEIVEAAAAPAERAVEAASEIAEAVAAPVTPAAEARADDLTRIKGIGPGLARQLNALGIRSFAQLAALTPDELAKIDEKLTSIKGRCFRDDWLGQAQALAGEGAALES